MKQTFWRWDRSLGFWTVALLFLGFEFILRAKLGDIFILAAVGGMAQQALNRRSRGVTPAVTGETILIGGYYAFGMATIIFIALAVLNIGLRTLNNSWTYFQLR